MNLDGSPGKSSSFRNVGRRRADGQEPRSSCVSPDRDIDLRRRFEALKGDLTVATANATSGDPHLHKQPLTLADIQGSIAKRHTSDLANAQRKWIESLNLQTPIDSGPSEEDAQKEWINHISVTKISDRPSRRDGQTARRSSERGFEHRSNVPSPKSSAATSPHKVPRNLTVRSTVLTPSAPTFGFCDVPHLTINSLPVTATSVKEVVKPDKEFVTESGKIIKMLKLEEPPKIEKKLKGKSPQRMKAVIDLDPTKQENRSNKPKDALKPQRSFRASLSPKKTKPDSHVASSLSPEAVDKYKLAFNHSKDHGKSSRSKSEHKSPRKLKRSSSLPGGLFKEKIESGGGSKHARNYDVKETRCFIKQKQKEREERMAEEKRKTAIEAEERKKKMQQLKDTQRKIMQKIKKRTVNKIRSPLVNQKDSDKPTWVGPLEATTSALDTSLELVLPKPKTAVLSEAAMGTITLKKKNPQPVHKYAGDHQNMLNVGTTPNFPGEPSSTSVATCTTTDEPATRDADGSSKNIFKDFCLKDLEVASDQSLHLKRPAPQLVETSTQIDFDDKSMTKKHKTGRTYGHTSSKGLKHTLPPEIVNKENLGTSDININDLPYSSRLDKFLAEYVPTPKKAEKTKDPQTPQWLQEMSQYPDQFNLINTLNKALRRQQKLESAAKTPTSKLENLPASSQSSRTVKLHESGCSLNQPFENEVLSAPLSRVSSSNSSSRHSELYLDPPGVSLTDDRLSSSSLATSSAHSFEKYQSMPPDRVVVNDRSDDMDVSGVHKLNSCNMTALAGEVTTTELSVLFPQTSKKSLRESGGKRDVVRTAEEVAKTPTIEILGEKIPQPKGAITLRKPLGHRTKIGLLEPPPVDLSSSFHEFVNPKRGSDPSNLFREQTTDSTPATPSSPEIPRSHLNSFNLMKEGSYNLLPPSDTYSDDTNNTFEVRPETSYQRFVRNMHGPLGPQSEHSSDSVSEIVKVSRTVSRGSTVISEEVSEMQNTLSVSTKSLKFNSSSIQNQIKNEIEHLDRVNQSLSSFMESGKMVLSREVTSASVVQSESAVEPLTQDVVTVKSKSPVLMDEIDSSMFGVPKNVLHSREPSGSSLDISLPSANGVDVTKLTVEMFDNLIKDEKLRSEQLVSGLKVRMKSLCNRTRKDLETIESQRKRLIEGGHDEEARELKRKQRGHIMKMNEEIEEMQRQRAMENKACQERCMLLKQQQQLIKLLLQSRRESSARNSRSSLKSLHMSQLDETVRYVGNERNSDIIDRKKREYREKEEALRERKKNVEAIVAWKKRLELEEKSVREMEKMIAQSSFTAPLPETVVERGTSPLTEIKDGVIEDAKAPESRIPASATSQSESEQPNKDYYSDSFEQSSVLSETAGLINPGLTQGSSLLNKAMKMPMLKVPLAPRVTIIKRRHSSGSDESMLLSQNDTLSEQSDVEVRVSALEQKLRHRKSELAKLKREYQKNQKERLRSTEKNLINQIHLYDSYIEQVKTEIKDLENSDVKVTKPQIKQPKFSERRQSDKFVVKSVSKDSSDVVDVKNKETSLASEDTSSHEASVLFLDKAGGVEEKVVESQIGKIVDSAGEVTEKLDQGTYSTEKDVVEENASDTADYDGFSGIEFSGVSTDPVLKAAMDKVKIKSMEPFADSESSVSDKDFSIEEILEKAEQSQLIDSSEVHTQTNAVTEATMSEIVTDNAKMHKMSVLREVDESLATQSQISESLDVLSADETSLTTLEPPIEELKTKASPDTQTSNDINIYHVSVQNQADSETANSISEAISRSTVVDEVIKTISDAKLGPDSFVIEKASDSVELKETQRDITQSKPFSNETVIDTLSELVKIPPAFGKYVSERNKIRDTHTGTTISEKLSFDLASESKTASPVLEQATDVEVSPQLLSGSFPFEVNVEDIHSLTFSPQGSPEILSEAQNSESNVDNVSEQILSPHSVSARILSSAVNSHQDLSEHVSSTGESPTLRKAVQGEVDDESQELQQSEALQQVVSSPPIPSAGEVSSESDKSGQISVSDRSRSSPQVSSKSARKRLDMDVDSGSKRSSEVKSAKKVIDDESASSYHPTMEIEGGKRSLSDLIPSDVSGSRGNSDSSSVSERIPTDQSGSEIAEEKGTTSKTEEISEAIEQVEEEELPISKTSKTSEDVSSAKDDVLDNLDFSLGSLDPYRPHVESSQSALKDSSSKTQSEAGDNYSVKLLNELAEDKKEQGQGDEPLRDLEITSIEADSLEDPFGQDFNSSFNAEDFAKYFESSFEKEPDLKLAPSKPLGEVAVIQLLQNSFELSDKIWEENLAMKKSSEETPLLSALQRERQQNVNVDSISQLIFDSFVDDATSAAMTAYLKKKHLHSIQTGHEDKDAELSPDKEVGDNEKFWLGDDFTLQAAHEAEQLRLRELQIQQEIEQLEQAQEVVPFYYVREIPNKPPPPYTPPKPAPPSKEETVSRVLQGGEILWDIEMSGGDPSEAAMPASFLPNLQDDPYRMFLFDLSKELYLKLRPRPSAPAPSWIVSKPRGKPLPPIRTKSDLLKHLEKETKLAFGFDPRVLRESLIMKWTRKRRDHVDEILVRELQEFEAEWRDLTVEENVIKNRIADALIADAMDEAVLGLSTAFTNKFKDLTVDQS